jgi:histidine ammonia-lyase
MGMTAALKLRAVVDHLEIVLAGEILAACQAAEFRKPLQLGEGTRKAYAMVRQVVPPLEGDRAVTPDIQAVRRLIRHGELGRLLGD